MNPSPYPAPFTSAHSRALVVKILLIAGAVAAAISALLESLSFAFPAPTEDQDLGDNPAGVAIMLVIVLLALIETAIYLATVVVFSMWLYRAHNNLRAFNSWARPDYSPGWAVGSFFIPFLNLVVPYRAVREVWQKSTLPDEAILSEPSPPATFPIWWAFWLLSSFAGNISMRVSFNENIDESTATTISIVASALSIVAAIFAYFVVDAIDKRQEEASRKAKLGKFSEPPPPPANLRMSDAVTSTL